LRVGVAVGLQPPQLPPKQGFGHRERKYNVLADSCDLSEKLLKLKHPFIQFFQSFDKRLLHSACVNSRTSKCQTRIK
jgi:hypothetical protein